MADSFPHHSFVQVSCPACFEELFTLGPVHNMNGVPVLAMPLNAFNELAAMYAHHVIANHTAGINDGSIPITSEIGMDEVVRRLLNES